jgi:octaprenyl-diphosphate synthase
VLDYSGNHANTGKNLGDDLAEGKPTLPLLYAMRQGTPEQAALIRSAIEGGIDGVRPVLTAIGETGARYARRQAEAERRRAVVALEALPHSPYRVFAVNGLCGIPATEPAVLAVCPA